MLFIQTVNSLTSKTRLLLSKLPLKIVSVSEMDHRHTSGSSLSYDVIDIEVGLMLIYFIHLYIRFLGKTPSFALM